VDDTLCRGPGSRVTSAPMVQLPNLSLDREPDRGSTMHRETNSCSGVAKQLAFPNRCPRTQKDHDRDNSTDPTLAHPFVHVTLDVADASRAALCLVQHSAAAFGTGLHQGRNRNQPMLQKKQRQALHESTGS